MQVIPRLLSTIVGGLAISLTIFQLIKQPSLRSVEDVPLSYFREKVVLTGEISRVIDGDTVKFFHWSFLDGIVGHFGEIKTRDTMTVRLAGVDTPEKATSLSTGQPFSIEARDYLVDKLLGKRVSLKLLSRDRYNRILGE